jgi:hypothetical protein
VAGVSGEEEGVREVVDFKAIRIYSPHKFKDPVVFSRPTYYNNIEYRYSRGHKKVVFCVKIV